MGFYTENELRNMNFEYIGKNVKLSRRASIYNAQYISIGNDSRVDDFCVVSAGQGGIKIGKNVHIAVYTSLIGRENITIDDYANLSSRVSVYSANDDYSGMYMTNPTVPSEYTNANYSPVYIGRHVIVGSGSVILPGIRLEEGAAIGSLSLVSESCEAFGIYAGVPVKYIKMRNKRLLELEKDLNSK